MLVRYVLWSVVWHLFLTVLLITKLHNHPITNHHSICCWCFCIVCYFVSYIVLPIVLFGLTTTKLNKLFYYYICHLLSVCLSVCLLCHKSEFYPSGWTDRACFWHRGYPARILYTVLGGNSGIFKHKSNSLWNVVPNCEFSRFYLTYWTAVGSVVGAISL